MCIQRRLAARCVPALLLCFAVGAGAEDPAKVDFHAQVLPILDKHCMDCHNRDAHKGGLGLGSAEEALKGGDSGVAAYRPGNSAESAIIQRVTSTDPGFRMPAKGDALSEGEIALLKKWIDEGASWSGASTGKAVAPVGADFWSFQKPVQAPLPSVKLTDWPHNPIDAFVLAKMEEHGLAPSPEADRYTLIRRVSLDLTGLPPAPEDIEAFVNDHAPDAYEKLVDRLLASPHYGEAQALHWMDAARYADTNGYEKDRPRSAWPYRDWLINAFNRDLPYDRFVIEQLAGDLLPGAAVDDAIATGFHRNTMRNEEGGIDVEEFRYEAMVDRTNTTGLVFLGLTFGCAQCHSHKYDPISHDEYFRFYAFLNNTDDVSIDVPDSAIDAKRADVQHQIDALVAELPNKFPGGAANLEERYSDWDMEMSAKARKWTVLAPVSCESKDHTSFRVLDDGSILACGDDPNTDTYDARFRTDLQNITAVRIETLTDPSLPGNGPGRGEIMSPGGDFLLSEIKASAAPWRTPDAFADVTLQSPTVDFSAAGRTPDLTLDGKLDTGWSINGGQGMPHEIVYQFAAPISHDGGTLLKLVIDQVYVHYHTIGRFRVSVTTDPLPVQAAGVPADIESILAKSGRSPEDTDSLKKYYVTVAPELADAQKQIAELRKSMPKFATAQVLREREVPRIARVFHRGEFLNPKDPVSPGVPAVLPPLPTGAPMNRLTLARWIVSKDNPLTARVFVNKVWQTYFGKGIVTSVDDFGARGDKPTHPELLDWLAVEFMRRDWDIKDLTRLIVTSAAYRQGAKSTPELLAADPTNEWLARAPRFRVDAEFVRDIALAASWLLSSKVGGPSVKPPLPDGALSIVYPGEGWTVAEGEDRYRRGMYVYWKRTLPYPAATTFDAPARDMAVVKRNRSNTPLQALTLLNDPVFVEAAQAFAKRVIAHDADDAARIRYAFMLCVSRSPDEAETKSIEAFLNTERVKVASQTTGTPVVLASDASDKSETSATPDDKDLAVWVLVCRSLLNLDETITRG